MAIALPGDEGFRLASNDGALLKRAPALVFDDRLFLFFVDQDSVQNAPDPRDSGVRRFARFRYVQHDQSSIGASPARFAESSGANPQHDAFYRIQHVELPVDFGRYEALEVSYTWHEIQTTESIDLRQH